MFYKVIWDLDENEYKCYELIEERDSNCEKYINCKLIMILQ